MRSQVSMSGFRSPSPASSKSICCVQFAPPSHSRRITSVGPSSVRWVITPALSRICTHAVASVSQT